MAWLDTLISLRDELAQVRAQRRQRVDAEEARLQQDRLELSRIANSLDIAGLLSQMNETLLQAQGEVETILSWESGGGGQDAAEELGIVNLDEDEGDVLSTVLTWEEDGEREIAVEIILDERQISLQVNGVEIRAEQDALQQALVEAFRDELEL
jgi:hypothetical protein